MTNTSQALKDTRRINNALMSIKDSFGAGDANIDDYVYIGGIRDVKVELSSTESEIDPSADCLFGETSSQPEWEASFVLLADKNPWFIRSFLSPNESDITVGASVSVTDEVISADYSVGEDTYLAVVNNKDWAVGTGGYVQNITNAKKVLDGATGNVVDEALAVGIDYTLTQLNGYTAIHTINGGKLGKGDEIKLDYDYTPMTRIVNSFGGETLLDTHLVRFQDDVNISGGDDSIREIIEFKSAEFSQSFVASYKNCTDRDSIEPSEITMRNAKGTTVDFIHES